MTPAFGGQYSIQLSYRRMGESVTLSLVSVKGYELACERFTLNSLL